MHRNDFRRVGSPFLLSSGLLLVALLATRAPAQDLDALLARMTLEEKAAQMTQLTLGAVSKVVGSSTVAHELDLEKLEDAVARRGLGSMLNTSDIAFEPEYWRKVITRVQEAAGRSRLKIPVLYGVDAVHGANYTKGAVLYPQAIGMGATWSPELVRGAAAATARDLLACGIPWNFGPVLDLGRQPLWSRFFETFGEDVLLVRTLSSAAIEGYQGSGRLGQQHVAACLKHFVGYGVPRSGKDRTPSVITERELRELHLRPFADAVKLGARTVMVNSGEVDGVPVHASRWLLTDILRKELGFEGVIVTDWEDVKKLLEMHRVADTYEDAVFQVIDAGVDLCMAPYDFAFADALVALVKSGRLDEKRLDASVKRLLILKRDLGLFEVPVPGKELVARVGNDEDRVLAYRAAVQSLTLLKNDGALPLRDDARVLLMGPGSDSLPWLFGSWSYTWQGTDAAAYPSTLKTLRAALTERLGAGRVRHLKGATVDSSPSAAEIEEAARDVDVVVIVVGEEPSVEKPGDIEDLELSLAQRVAVLAARKVKKPVVCVLLQDRPRLVRSIVDKTNALLLAYRPGAEGAAAIVDVLLGVESPGGRLPFTYPRHPGSFVTYDRKRSEDADSRFGWDAFSPQFPLGHGLSYTTTRTTSVTLDREVLHRGETLTVNVTVENTGSRPASEVVLVFVTDLVASITPPVERVRAFRRVEIPVGERAIVTFTLKPEDLAFVGRDQKFRTEPGRFSLRVGDQVVPFSYVETR